jgi:hypothetical protein
MSEKRKKEKKVERHHRIVDATRRRKLSVADIRPNFSIFS